jgi:hypothetical protein
MNDTISTLFTARQSPTAFSVSAAAELIAVDGFGPTKMARYDSSSKMISLAVTIPGD